MKAHGVDRYAHYMKTLSKKKIQKKYLAYFGYMIHNSAHKVHNNRDTKKMNSIQFTESVKTAFLQRFPQGWINASKLALGGGMVFRAGMISNIEDQTSKIRDNDPLQILMFLHDTPYNSDKELSNVLIEFEYSSIKVLPTEKYCAMSSHKIPVRKMNNAPEKVLVNLGKYFDKVLAEVQAQAAQGNIYQQYRIPANYLPK